MKRNLRKRPAKNMVKKCLISLGMMFILSSAFAGMPVVETYYQHKEKTTEYIIEKDDDEDYKDDKYYIKLDEDLTKRLNTTFSFVNYRREYLDNSDINNKIRDYKNTWDYYFYKDKAGSLKLDVNLAYRTKRYEDKEILDFNRSKANAQLTWVDEGNWRITLRGGTEYYDFIKGVTKDKKLFSEKLSVKRYLNDEKLILIAGGRLKQTDLNQKNKDKNETELDAGIDIKTDYRILEKISLRGEWGERNTVEDEEYDEEDLNYDYTYTRVKARTAHGLLDNFETALRGEIKNKAYEEVDYDYNSYILGNEWNWKYYLSKAKERKRYIQAGLDLIYGQAEYDILENSSHYKDGATLELAYKKWGEWAYTIEAGITQYRYDFSAKDRDVYRAGIILSRKFFNRSLELNLEYDYRIKDYLSSDRGNVYQNSFLVGGVWRW